MNTTDEIIYLKQQAEKISNEYPNVEVLCHGGAGERWMELHYREDVMPDTLTVDGRPMPLPPPGPDPSLSAVGEALAACRQVHREPRVLSESHDGVRMWRIELPVERSGA